MAAKKQANVLRSAREKLGLSQTAIAARLGITPAAVGHYENGLAKPPVERAKQMAKMLKIDVAKIAVSERVMRGSGGRTAIRAASGEKVSAREREVLDALRSIPLTKRRPAVEMLLGYVERVRT